MAEIGKIALALFLVGFWLFLPIPMQLFKIYEYDTINIDDNNVETSINILDSLGLYFNMLVFNIPNVSVYIRYFINFLQIATALFILIMIRGN